MHHEFQHSREKNPDWNIREWNACLGMLSVLEIGKVNFRHFFFQIFFQINDFELNVCVPFTVRCLYVRIFLFENDFGLGCHFYTFFRIIEDIDHVQIWARSLKPFPIKAATFGLRFLGLLFFSLYSCTVYNFPTIT